MRDAGFLFISLRPAGGHDSLRRAAARRGGRLLAMSPWRIARNDDAASRAALDAALSCPLVVFTSPAAVAAAVALRPLRGPRCLAVGEGTRRALQRAGVAHAQAPARMDSEGLLAMPAMAGLERGDALGLVSAPGGRGEIVRQLSAKGVDVRRADVYARVPLPLPAARIARLQAWLDEAAAPACLALTSGEAFGHLLAQWPAAGLPALRRVTVIAASERLAALAREQGFPQVRLAASPRPADLAAAAPG